MIDSALYLASLGFHVFPGEIKEKNGKMIKKPLWRGWQEDATCDLEIIERIWRRVPHAIPCISTSYYTNGDLWHLLVIDVDIKDGRNGARSLSGLPHPLPATFVQRTATGGYHYVYKTRFALRNTSGRLGSGLDTRGWGGFIVGVGSFTLAGQYTIALNEPVAEAPQWLVDLVGVADTREPIGEDHEVPEFVDRAAARAWAVRYLASLPVAMNGTIDDSAFAACAALRERGLGLADTYAIMEEHFKSELPVGRLEDLVHHAAKYSKTPPGSSAPEILFKEKLAQDPSEAGGDCDDEEGEKKAPSLPPAGTPITWFNEKHAVCLIGSACYVLRQGLDSKGKPKLFIMGIEAFHTYYAGLSYVDGEGKTKPLSRVWMNSKDRATFQGLEFAPGRALPEGYYNLWQGFTYEPQQVGSERAHRALENFKHHMLHNFARGDQKVCHYGTSLFAQMYQKPQDKMPVSLVLRGEKGSGKDTLMNILGAPLGPHYMFTSRGSDLTGQFNSSLESKLLCVYNEAFWAHDNKAEAVLKDLVTGNSLRIERKGCEPYWVDNLSRTVIMGNATVQVPATPDERRWWVVDMRDIPDEEKEAHAEFCTQLREDMEAGGYNLLVDYLLNYDCSGVNLRIAPNSQGLVEQKMAGLHPVQMWFRECLGAGALVGCGTPMGWPERVDKEILREAFRRWAQNNDFGGRKPGEDAIGCQLAKMKLGIDGTVKRTEGKRQINQYALPLLEDARKGWDRFIKAVTETKW